LRAFGGVGGEGAIAALAIMGLRARILGRRGGEAAQDADKSGQVAVVVPKRLTGLLAVIGCAGRRVVLVVVMTEMLGGLVLFVPAIIRHRCPGDLEREQAKQDEREQTSHGEHYIYNGLPLSMFGDAASAHPLRRG